jgi:hypothetical protein
MSYKVDLGVPVTNGWATNNNYAAAQTNTSLKAAQGSSLSLYITDLIFSTDAAINFKIVEDTGGTPATVLGPYYFAANGGMAKRFKTPVKISLNKDIGITSVGTANHSITLVGFVITPPLS